MNLRFFMSYIQIKTEEFLVETRNTFESINAILSIRKYYILRKKKKKKENVSNYICFHEHLLLSNAIKQS